MTLGETLVQMGKLHPHYFNSFYRRVRVVRETPQPMPAAATVDVTHRCALQCPFCIAADVLDQRDMSYTAFEQICQHLQGIGRLTLIGGEPFQHPQFTAMVVRAREAAAEVEVFTNGLALGTNATGASERLLRHIPEAADSWLTLVLSVDPGHAAQMSPGRLQAVVDGVLLAASEGLCKARFSVTHPALATGIYLDTDTVTTAIAEVAPKLATHFTQRLEEGRVQESFYFNSVICALPPTEGLRLDSTIGNTAGPEVLRLEDLTWSPEVAVTFDGEGAPEVFSSLASMWSNRPPEWTRLGGLQEAGARLLRRSFAEHGELADLADECDGPLPPATHPAWAEGWAGAADEASRGELLRAWLPFHEIIAWDGGGRLTRERAKQMATLVAGGIGDRVLRFGGDEGVGVLDGLQMRSLVEQLTDNHAELLDLAEGTASSIAPLFGSSDNLTAPVYAGARELLGKRVPQAPGEQHLLARVHLPQEPGFGNRDELVVRPLLQLFPGGRRRLLFPGITTGEENATVAVSKALNRLLEMVTCIGGQQFCQAVVAHLPESLASLSHELPTDRQPMGASHDLLAAFVECSFDRNRQQADEGNGELLTLLLAHGDEHFSPASMRNFTSRCLTWVERLHRHRALTSGARARLAQLKLKGKDAKRLARLLDLN